jgi:hypothetical protein
MLAAGRQEAQEGRAAPSLAAVAWRTARLARPARELFAHSRLQEASMLREFLVGALISVCTITIHAMIMTAVVRASQAASAIQTRHASLLLAFTMIATVSVLMAAHACEVAVWALGYRIVDAAPAGANLLYFAFVNYTTLGYGDVLPVERWQLLGPITAMNGVLLFGWSTAVIFEVLRRSMQQGSIIASAR